QIACRTVDGTITLPYDRLVFALGSELVRPPVPGLAGYGFDVDTYDAAARLGVHLAGLAGRPDAPGRSTAGGGGGGLTGVEAATELVARLRELSLGEKVRVVLADRAPHIGSSMGDGACAVIGQALRDLGVETRAGVTLTQVDAAGVTFSSGER